MLIASRQLPMKVAHDQDRYICMSLRTISNDSPSLTRVAQWLGYAPADRATGQHRQYQVKIRLDATSLARHLKDDPTESKESTV